MGERSLALIFITGAARSGTTLVTDILERHGLNLGPTNSLKEHLGVREEVTKPFLRQIGCDPSGQRTLPDTDNLQPLIRFGASVAKQLSGIPDPRGVKDAKFTLIWPVVNAAFPDALWVIVRRNREDIADSCARTSFMGTYGEDRQAWGRWVDEHIARFDRMKSKMGKRVVEIWPASFIADPETFRPAAKHCGLEFDARHVTGAIDRDRFKTA